MLNLLKDEITSDQLTKEILLLLNDYFVGKFEEKDNEVLMSFENGQRFKLSVEEV